MNKQRDFSMSFSLAIFDLDGTLLDTVGDIGNAANRVLIEAGHSPHPLSAYRRFVGSGVAVLFERALPKESVTPNVIDHCISNFEREYEACWNRETVPYDGMGDLLDRFSSLGLRLSVLSNKPDSFAKKCVREYFSDYRFEPTLGQRPDVPRKPDPAAVREIMEYHQVVAEQVFFVGDSEIDIQTAQNAGVFSIGVSWGYRPASALVDQGVDLLAEEPGDLLSFVEENT